MRLLIIGRNHEIAPDAFARMGQAYGVCTASPWPLHSGIKPGSALDRFEHDLCPMTDRPEPALRSVPGYESEPWPWEVAFYAFLFFVVLAAAKAVQL